MKLDSPALAAIYNEIRSSRYNNILDLGEMRAGTFSFFSSMQCDFHAENLREFVIEHQHVALDQFKTKLDGFIRFNNSDKKFDIILMWDLLNYLPTEHIVYLFNKLKPACNENTLVHSLTYMTKSVPQTPARVSIMDNDHINVEVERPLVPNSHRRTSLSLVKNLSDFMMETNLFSNANVTTGIKEDLLRYVPHLENAQKNLTKKAYSVNQNLGKPAHQLINKQGFSLYRFPGLWNVLSHTQAIEDSSILDLGYDNQTNGKGLLNYANTVIAENLPALMSIRDGKSRFQLNSKSIVFNEPMVFDVILAWDLFHYFPDNEITTVAERIRQHCRPGTLIHTICYSTPEIALKPRVFYLQKEEEVLMKDKIDTQKAETTLNSMRLLKLFQDADIKHTFLLQPGMPKGLYEFVLEIKAN